MTATPTNIKENDLFSSPVAYKDVDRVVNKVHLKKLEHCPIIPCRNISSNIAETACFFQIKRVVLDQKEDILQKLDEPQFVDETYKPFGNGRAGEIIVKAIG